MEKSLLKLISLILINIVLLCAFGLTPDYSIRIVIAIIGFVINLVFRIV